MINDREGRSRHIEAIELFKGFFSGEDISPDYMLRETNISASPNTEHPQGRFSTTIWLFDAFRFVQGGVGNASRSESRSRRNR